MKFSKAIVLISLFALLFACSNKDDNYYFKQAQKHLARQEYKKAVDSFIAILDNFPESEHAPKAALEIAKLYHGNAISGVPRDEALRIAVKYYKMCNSLAPESAEGTNALFMAAFVEANELKDYDAAKKTYREFIDKYPDNPMVQSAKIEIQTLGIEPEKIIERQIKATDENTKQ
jgi:outer membrane protein assembly factor BamD (BamD/ComL family)